MAGSWRQQYHWVERFGSVFDGEPAGQHGRVSTERYGPLVPDFSSRTVGTLAQLLDRVCSHSDLDNLFLRYGLRDAPFRSGKRPNKLVRATSALDDALRKRDNETIKLIIDEIIEGRSPDAPDKLVDALGEALRSDGWTLDAVEYESTASFSWDTRISRRYELHVLGAGPHPLVDEISPLERQLRALNLSIAAGHYRQAVDAHTAARWASANSQLRATLESVIVVVARKLDPSSRFSNGGGAIAVIDRTRSFDKGERSYIEGLWTIAHTNGSHPGLGDEEESTNRLSAITAAIGYLMRRFL